MVIIIVVSLIVKNNNAIVDRTNKFYMCVYIINNNLY